MVKVFIKPDPGISLINYHRRLKSTRIPSFYISIRLLSAYVVNREALSDIANVYNYQAFVETDKAGYIIRQWVASSLYDRIRFVFAMFSLL